MLIILSPSKTLDFNVSLKINQYTQPQYLKESEKLMKILKKLSPKDLQLLMKINYKLADLTAKRFYDWNIPFTSENARQAIFVFKGEVYNGLQANELNEDELIYSQNVMLILSGLYGVLRPLDLIQAYRLEMQTKLVNPSGYDLYAFWADKITKSLNQTIKNGNHQYLINLASAEYFKVCDTSIIKCKIITPTFKDFSNGAYRFLTVYGKKARGAMARFIIKNRLTDIESLKLFDDNGYIFNHHLSSDTDWVFTRG